MSDRNERALGATFAPGSVGFIDFETRSQSVDLKAAGAYAYVVDAHATVLAYALGESPAKTVVAREYHTPLHWRDMPDEIGHFHSRVLRGEAVWCAWNAPFDRAVWNYSTVGFPALAAHHIIDAAAQGAAAGLPRDLTGAGRICGTRKLETGKALIKLFAVPGATATPASHPKEWAEFLLYARQDVEALRSIFRRTLQLPLAEWREYFAMEAINERGVHIDIAMATHAAELAAEDRARNGAELSKLTAGAVTTVSQTKRMVNWLMARLPPEGRSILTLREEEADEDGVLKRPAKHSLNRHCATHLIAYCSALLADPTAAANAPAGILAALRLLQIRLYGGAATPAKFRKLLAQRTGDAVLGQYVFNGAGQTGRASSRGVQIHNLARDTLPYEHEAIELLLRKGSYEQLMALGDDTPVARKLSLLIRPVFVPAPGNVFVGSDWSQIEARVLPWLAGATGEGRLNIFREVDADPEKPDLYTRTAATLSNVPIKDVTKPMRQRGKVAELALGFGGGVGALQSMAANYGMYLDPAEAKLTVERWREANPWCVQFWGKHTMDTSYGLWGAAHRAMREPGVKHGVGRVSYIYLPNYLGGSLLCELPSKRMLTYRAIREDLVADLDDQDRVIGHTWHLRCGRGAGRIKVWPGLLTENIVQAVAADCLRGTLRRLESGHYKRMMVRLQTHDEVLVEVNQRDAREARAMLRGLMQTGFDWSAGLPLMSEETVAYYYTKAETGHESEDGIAALSAAHDHAAVRE
jgi:DNA polymerase bacteriophage-type